MRRVLAVAATLALLVGVLGPVQTVLAVPPANDNFADALVISELPSYSLVDLTEATAEAGEPYPSCAFGYELKSAWFAYTPTTTAKLTVYSESYGVVAAYTGSAIDSLTEIGCRTFYSKFTFDAAVGTTYYFLLSPLYPWNTGYYSLRLMITPPPTADFYYYPYDANSFDSVHFSDYSNDPGEVGINSWEWDFGDGASSVQQSPSHRYTADGDYTVNLAIATSDGRTGSATKTVSVRTHDVAITRFTVPGSASSNQTRQITVGVSNSRYSETVMVRLDKSVYGGWTALGNYTQYVPARGPYRTTTFSFNYTFTKDDAAVGKVTFRAEAYIQSGRDALPADNTAISFPTKVTK